MEIVSTEVFIILFFCSIGIFFMLRYLSERSQQTKNWQETLNRFKQQMALGFYEDTQRELELLPYSRVYKEEEVDVLTAECLLSQAKYMELEEFIFNALRNAPKNFHLLKIKARICYRQDDYAGAISIYEKIPQNLLDRDDISEKIECMIANDQLEEARNIIHDKQVSDEPRFQLLLADSYYHQKQYQSAVQFYYAAYQKKIFTHKSISNLARCFVFLGKNDHAMRVLNQACMQFPNSVDMLLDYSSCFERNKNYQKALEVLSSVSESIRKHPKVISRMGIYLFRLKYYIAG